MILAAELFGSKHIIGLVIMLIVIGIMFVVSEYVLKSNQKKIMYLLLILFYGLEIAKILYIWIRNGSYPMNHLPFHLCSLPLYLMPLVTFVKNEKALKFIWPSLVGGLLFGGFMAMIYPSTILGEGTSFLPLSENVLPLMSFVYHPVMIFTAIYFVYKGIYKIEFTKFLYGFPLIIMFMLMAMVVNKIGDKDFMLLNRGTGSPFQFLQETSQLLYVVSMILLGLFGIFLFHTITLAFYRTKQEAEVYTYNE